MFSKVYRSMMVNLATNRSLTTLALIAVLTIVLAACDGSGANALHDTSWELASLAGNGVLPGTTITIEFSGDQVSGSAGCNQYGGSYQARGDSLSVSDVFSTEMGCPGARRYLGTGGGIPRGPESRCHVSDRH